MFGTVSTKLVHKKRENIYKNSTGNVTFDPSQIEAWSYKWWKFVSKENGLVIFNDYNYSSTTNAHQSLVRDLMKQLKIKIDVIVYSRKGLQDNYKKEIYEDIYSDMFLAEYKLMKKGMSKKVKQEQKYIIKNCAKKLNKLKKIVCPISTQELQDLKKKVIDDYEYNLLQKRIEAKEKRELKKQMLEQVKDQLNDLSPIKKIELFDNLNNLNAL